MWTLVGAKTSFPHYPISNVLYLYGKGKGVKSLEILMTLPYQVRRISNPLGDPSLQSSEDGK